MRKISCLPDWISFRARSFVVIAAGLLFPAAAAANNCSVTCGNSTAAYSTIAAALASLPLNSPTEPYTINVTGTCNENVSFGNRQRITIQAASDVQTATIAGPNLNSAVLWIGRSRGIILRQLVISGGSRGVMIDDSSEVEMDQCTVKDTAGVGIQVSDMSNLRLDRATIQNNRSTGLVVDDNSYATVGEMALPDQLIHIHDNEGAGISVTNSVVMVRGATIIENNSSVGISLSGSRFLLRGTLAENFVRNNRSFGVTVSDGSTATFTGRNTIQGNSAIGIQVGRGSTASFNTATMPDQSAGYTIIENHDQLGMNIAAGGTVLIAGPHKVRDNGGALDSPDKSPYRGGFRVATGGQLALRLGAEVSNNSGQGIWVEVGASVGLGYPAETPGATVSGNTREGVRVVRGSNLWIGSPSTVVGNGIANISCDDSAWLSGNLAGISGISCKNVLHEDEKKK